MYGCYGVKYYNLQNYTEEQMFQEYEVYKKFAYYNIIVIKFLALLWILVLNYLK